MNYPRFDFPIDVSHETWLLSPPTALTLQIFSQSLKKHTRAQRQRGKRSPVVTRGDTFVRLPLVQECSVNTINVFRQRKRIEEKGRKNTNEIEVGLTVANELLSLQPVE